TATKFFFFFSSRRRHTRSLRDWSSDVCSSDLLFDGKLDLVLTANNGPARLLRNDNELKHHWIRLTLAGDGKRSNRDAIGARITRSEERRVGKECRSRWWAKE